MLSKFSTLSLLTLGFIFSCSKPTFFMNYKDFNGQWPVYEKVLFTLDKGSENTVNLMIYIRNNKNYPYSNLFLIAKLKTGDSLLLCDTLEYAMADAQGQWLGKGFLEVKESKLWWRENYQLPAVENINVQLEHALRSYNSEKGLDTLEGIVGVGFAIEEIQDDE